MAVEDEMLQSVVSGGKSALVGVYDVITWVIIALIVGALIFFLLWLLSHKHKVVIRVVTKNRKYIIFDRAKPIIEDGVPMWRLLKMKKKVTPPPPEAIEITKKGRYHAECYWSEDNPEPCWLEDKGEQHGSLHPFKTQERALHVARQRRAMSRKGLTTWEKVSQILLPITMITIVALPFVFFGELTKEVQDMADAVAGTAETNAKISQQNARMMSILVDGIDTGELKIQQQIPPDAVLGGVP